MYNSLHMHTQQVLNGRDVPELDHSHSLDEQQEVDECNADLLRVVMKVVLEEGQQVAQKRVTQPVLKH